MTEVINKPKNLIGTLNESSLHRELKEIYRNPGDELEVKVGKYHVDIVRENLLIEIQVKNFSAIRSKLENLLQNHKVLLVHPIIRDKWILSLDIKSNQVIRRNLSPKHCSFENIFEELLRIPHLISHPNLIIELVLIQAEEIRINDGKGSWRRRGWSIQDLKLVNILEYKVYSNSKQFFKLIPEDLNVPFTNKKLASYLKKNVKLARMMTYSLRKMGLIEVIGKKERSLLFNFVKN
ncbi:MAG: hypothetical protein ACTSUT_04325 [Promethearchaeota archaeon]